MRQFHDIKLPNSLSLSDTDFHYYLSLIKLTHLDINIRNFNIDKCYLFIIPFDNFRYHFLYLIKKEKKK